MKSPKKTAHRRAMTPWAKAGGRRCMAALILPTDDAHAVLATDRVELFRLERPATRRLCRGPVGEEPLEPPRCVEQEHAAVYLTREPMRHEPRNESDVARCPREDVVADPE